MKDLQTNYTSIGETSVHDDGLLSVRYQEYRRQWRENPREGFVSDFPLNVDLEVTSACNLKCAHCARTSGNWGYIKSGFVNEHTAEKVIAEVGQEAGYAMKFSLRGEPLLHRGLLNFLRRAGETPMVDYYFNTNGMLLNEEYSRDLIKLGVPRISISVGGWDEESFNQCQTGADFLTVYENAKFLKNYRDSLGSARPRIRIQAVGTHKQMKHLAEFVELWRPLSDELGLIDFRQENGESDHAGVVLPDFHCEFLWQRLVVLWDGSVFPCLFHGVEDNSSLLLGNVKEESLKSLWRSERLLELRAMHRSGRSHLNPGCAHCSYRTTVAAKSNPTHHSDASTSSKVGTSEASGGSSSVGVPQAGRGKRSLPVIGRR